MSENNYKTYDEIGDETFIINDTRLNVLPMDVTLFSDNAIYGSSFLRSRAVFSYRSKHAREKIILTLPVSISVNSLTNDPGAIYSRQDGLKVLTQLSNYPFCFIKSPRIESYVAPAGGISNAGFMIFGVEQITTVQDMSTPDVLFIEYHLIFCNHTPLIKNFSFKCNDGSIVDYPHASDQFVEAFSNLGTNASDVNAFIGELGKFLNTKDVQSGGHYETNVPYGSTVLLAPHMYDVEQNSNADEATVTDFSSFNPEEIKTIEISASKGAAAPALQMLEDAGTKQSDFEEGNKEILNIAWSAMSDLSMLGQSALQSVRVTRYNKLARHFVSAHKHPVLQYMGRSPSRVEMTFHTNTSNAYTTEYTSLVEAYTQLFNILDYNAMMFPAANAYNYLKLKSVVGLAMGVEKLIPNQKYISSSSSKQGVETINMTFIETNVEEFLEEGKVEQGRESGSAANPMRDAAVEAFLPNFNPSLSNLPFTNTLKINLDIIQGMANALKAMAVEFAKGYSQSRFADQERWDKLVDDLKLMAPEDRSANLLLGGALEVVADTIDMASGTLRNIFTGGHYSEIQALVKAFLERSKYRQIYIYEGKQAAASKLANIQIKLQVKTGRTDTFGWENKTVSAGNSDNFVVNGSVDMNISKIFVAIKNLADMGDTKAKAALSRVNASTEALNEASISSYTGVNYPDLNIPGINESQAINPMYFLSEDLVLSLGDLNAAESIVAENFDATIDDALSNPSKLDESASKSSAALRAPVLHKKDEIEEQAYIKENDGNFFTNLFGERVDGVAINGAVQSTYTGSGSLGGSSSTTKQKYHQIRKAALAAGDPHPDIVAAQFGFEAGWGASESGKFNYFGIKATGNEPKSLHPTTEVINGRRVKTMGWFRDYSSLEAGIADRIKFIKVNTRYTKAGYFSAKTPYQAAKALEIGGYATEPHYANKLVEVMRGVGIDSNKTSTELNSSLGQAKVAASSTGVKKENTTIATLTREDIKAKCVKATVIHNDNHTGSWFDASVNGKVVRVNIKGVVLPVPPLAKEIQINGSKKIKYTEKGQKFGKQAKEYLNSLLKSGFYIEKTNSSSISTVVYDMNFEDVGKKLVQQGLALPTSGSNYKLGNSNFGAQKDRINPNTFIDNLKKYRAEVMTGSRKLADIVEPGTKPIYTDGSVFDQNAVAKANEKISANSVNFKPSTTTNTFLPFKSGTGTVTSQYGKYRPKYGRRHYGIDCTPSDGSKDIVSAAKGIVVQAGWSGEAGQRVRVWHDKIGFSSQYFHLHKLYVREGQSISAGTPLGQMGGSGAKGLSSYDVHGHYQVGFGNAATGNLVDPWKTTRLSEIPDYNGGGGGTGLKLYAEKFLNPKYYTNYLGEDIRNTGKVYKGANANMSGASSSGNDGNYFANSNGGSSDAYAGAGGGAIAIKPTLSQGGSRGIDNEHSVFNKDLIIKKQLQNMIYPFAQGMNTAFPVVRAYVTVGSDNEDLFLREAIRLGYYFELNGIEALSLACNNDDNPVDLVRMSIANPSFALTDDYSVTGKYLTTNMESIYGPDEVRWVADRIKLKPGAKLHIRAGYGNDPNKLQTIFNGVITEMSSSKSVILNLICEGFGRELLATQIEPIKHKPAGGEWHNSSTGVIFAKALLQDGITHFGTTTNTLQFVSTWLQPVTQDTSADDKTDPEAKRLITRAGGSIFSGSNGFGFFYDKGNIRQRLFTNIYAAEIDKLHPEFSSNLWNYLSGLFSLTEKAGYYYIFEGQTPWEACKEMEFRHPGTKVKPLFYDDRMTLFFGLKEQMYIARDLNPQYMASVAKNDGDIDSISIDYLKQRPKRMELVTKMHIANSNTNIISNGLALNSEFCTGVNVVFFEDNEERQNNEEDDFGEFKMTVDDNLNFWEYRYKTISMPGTHGKYSSFMYGTTALRRESEKMYSGKILLIGNPNIKAGDFVYLDDEINKMTGIVKVRECTHHYNENGYVTEITPGLYVESSNFFYTTLFLRLGLTAQIASTFSTIGVQTSAFSGQNFSSYYEVFQAYKHLTESTNIDKINNGVAYNTGYGLLPAAALTMNALLGYSVYKTTKMLGLSSAHLAAAARYGAKGVKNVAAGMSFAGKALAGTYRMSKGAQTATQAGAASRIIAGVVKAAKSASTSSKGLLAFKLLKTIRNTAAAGAAFLAFNPFTAIAGAIGMLAFAYVDGLIQESVLTRQPLMYFPINYVGRPYTAGISGYKYNSWLESKKENLSKNMENTRKGLTEISMTRPESFATTVLGWLNGSNTKVADSIVTVQQEQALTKAK